MSKSAKVFRYGEDQLTAGMALDLAHGKLKGILSSDTRSKVRESRNRVLKLVAKGEPVYGINTGFGPLCTTEISAEETQILQENILKSHSVGVGPPVEQEIAKLMLILKVQALAKGFSASAGPRLTNSGRRY